MVLVTTTNSNGRMVLFNTFICGNTQLNKLSPGHLYRLFLVFLNIALNTTGFIIRCF